MYSYISLAISFWLRLNGYCLLSALSPNASGCTHTSVVPLALGWFRTHLLLSALWKHSKASLKLYQRLQVTLVKCSTSTSWCNKSKNGDRWFVKQILVTVLVSPLHCVSKSFGTKSQWFFVFSISSRQPMLVTRKLNLLWVKFQLLLKNLFFCCKMSFVKIVIKILVRADRWFLAVLLKNSHVRLWWFGIPMEKLYLTRLSFFMFLHPQITPTHNFNWKERVWFVRLL